MTDASVAHATINIEREFAREPAAVFACFADAASKRRWFIEGGNTVVDEFEMDFRVGGIEKMRSRFGPGTPLPEGTPWHNDTWYCDIIENQRIAIAYVMTIGGARISASLATFEFRATDAGTKLLFTEQAAFFEHADGPGMRRQGWLDLFDRLAGELAG